ncbi:MAG: hypothetical protein M3O78_02845 [Chloroflexota bacterium]|nr:hypothetical protein [Chloroflexota bacterium]
MSVRQVAQPPCAVGRLAPQGPWIGFQPDAGGYSLVVGINGALRSSEADVDLLLSLAIAYFTEALDEAPPEVEATQADLSALVAELAQRETDPETRRLLREALDAIDDGLAGDAVASRLVAARPHRADSMDPIELLRMRGMELAGRS